MKKLAQNLLDQMSDFEYGWIDKNGYKYVNKIAKAKFITDYFLQKPKDMNKTNIGICWDHVEYERKFFTENNIPHKTIFIIYEDGVKYPNHTFLIFKERKKYYWFENTYKDAHGILEFDTLGDCLENVKKEFMKENKLEEIGEKLFYYVYEKPESEIGAIEFITHCQKGIKADNDFKNIDVW